MAIVFSDASFSQEFKAPNYALKSHETLEIARVETTAQATVISLVVENIRSEGGYFCADKNIFIIYPDGTRSKLKSSSGIPVCPDSYKFRTAGEKLSFVLTFPPLKKGIQYIDLLEDCNDNCFSFYGIILDNDLNKMIDDAFVLVEKGESANAMNSFINIAEKSVMKNPGVEGLLYLNIIKLARETGNTAKADEWYKKLASSTSPGTARYIKYLNDQGIKY
jgi:hypothetical protein